MKLLETKDLIGKASNRWMATSWPICRWLLRQVDLQWHNRWSNKWPSNKTTCTTSLKLPIFITTVNVKAPKEQSLTLEISMTRMRQEENNQGAKESAGSVSWRTERKNIVERIKKKEEAALLGLLHSSKKKKGSKKSRHQRHHQVELHGLLAKKRSNPSRLV